MTNPNYSTYLGTATQLQRWRDFIAHAAAYLCFNIVFVVVWSVTGNGPFWPPFPLVGWGIGLTFQHHVNTCCGPVTDDDVTRRMRQHHKTIGASAARTTQGPFGRARRPTLLTDVRRHTEDVG